ncbi:catecholate siderophore receptor [Methylobacillus rhizosphaerae]|uniref:Catecholate siderophore receptor n=1 Tax=Methylobacillus rhizosphaerae TaxID=551994 RepID=A0A238Y189_9PROT|nr:TonB-dependent siderophore receptor [Methylobacillus rhizosphaerae]SNR64897.1 catecholate siderophore receptor [Methylobacillus rhizosphaerae]
MAKVENTSLLFNIKPTVSALAIAFTAVGGAHAAEENVQGSEVSTLPEVNVTSNKDDVEGYKVNRASSTKFTAPLLDTPKSVTVLTEDLIRDQGATTFEQALRTVPGITFGAGEGGTPMNDRPFIRGYDSSSSTFVDGLRDLGSQSREIFNIERVEVLKGPSGAFDGRGSGGGSINIVTKTPKAENFVRGSVGLGTDSYKRGTLDVNYLLSDDVALRINAMAHDADVPGRDAVDVKRWGFAPSITFGLNSPTSLTLSYYKLKTDDMPDYGLPLTSNIPAGTIRKPVSGINKDNFYGLKDRDFRKTEIDSGTATIKHAFNDDISFRNVTRYAVSRNDYIVTNPDDSAGNVANGTVWRNSKSRNSKTESFGNLSEFNFKFDTAEIKHNLSAGFEYSYEYTTNTPYLVTNAVSGRDCTAANMIDSYTCTSLYNPNPSDPWLGTIAKGLTTTKSRTQTKSFYVFDSAEIAQDWILNLGLRRDIYSTGSDALNSSTNVRTKLDNDSAFWNYQAGLVYKIQPNASIYISHGTSSTATGTSNGDGTENISAATENLAPERTKNYEIGAKWDVLSNLSLTSAIFYTEKDNARVTLADGTTALAGNQKVRGFEFGFAGAVTPSWQVFGGYTYLDSELVDNGTATAQDGNEFPGIAKNSANIWTTYNVTDKWTVGGGANYMDRVYANTANTIIIPSYTRFDAMTSYKIDKNLTLQLNVLNLTDKRYYDKTFTTHFANVAAGRSAMLSLMFNY